MFSCMLQVTGGRRGRRRCTCQTRVQFQLDFAHAQEALDKLGLTPSDAEGAAAWEQRRAQADEALELQAQTERLQTDGLDTAW